MNTNSSRVNYFLICAANPLHDQDSSLQCKVTLYGVNLNYFNFFKFPGVSSTLMGVMGYRFLMSKKIFPAGVVSLVSLVMTGGYIHGVLRSMH